MPFGYLEFSRAIRGEPYPHMRVRRGRPVLVPNSGSGSLPGPVLFESGLTGMGYAEHARSAIRIQTAQRNCCQHTAANSWAVVAVAV